MCQCDSCDLAPLDYRQSLFTKLSWDFKILNLGLQRVTAKWLELWNLLTIPDLNHIGYSTKSCFLLFSFSFLPCYCFSIVSSTMSCIYIFWIINKFNKTYPLSYYELWCMINILGITWLRRVVGCQVFKSCSQTALTQTPALPFSSHMGKLLKLSKL